MDKQIHIIKPMSRKQLADAYGISTKMLSRRMFRVGLNFGNDRVLLPAQIKEIIDLLGPWTMSYTDKA